MDVAPALAVPLKFVLLRLFGIPTGCALGLLTAAGASAAVSSAALVQLSCAVGRGGACMSALLRGAQQGVCLASGLAPLRRPGACSVCVRACLSMARAVVAHLVKQMRGLAGWFRLGTSLINLHLPDEAAVAFQTAAVLEPLCAAPFWYPHFCSCCSTALASSLFSPHLGANVMRAPLPGAPAPPAAASHRR